MSDIFLSYASEDRERVRPLAAALATEGWSVFWDRKIPVGKTWQELLEGELESARSLVIVWSSNSVKSKWVRAEANEGLRLDLPLFPVSLDAVLPPLGFRDIQAADLSQWDGEPGSPLFQSLRRDIESVLGRPATPEPEPLKPEITESTSPETEDIGPELAAAKVPEPMIPEPEPMAPTPSMAEPMVPAAPEPERAEPPLPEPTAPEVKKGRLWVETEPSEAKITLPDVPDQFSQGMELEPGRYEVEVSAEGFEQKRELVEIGPGEDRHLKCRLAPYKTAMEEKAAPAPSEVEPAAPSQEAGVIEPEAVAAKPEAPPETELPQPPEKSRLPLVRAVLGLAVVVLLLGWWLFSPGPPKPPKTPEEAAKPIPSPPTEMKPFTNSIGMKFVLIPAGTFPMGSPPGEDGRDDDERQHQVTISRPFYLQTTEVTQGQWQEVMGSNPSYFNNCGKNCPVEQVSWDDAQKFIKKLNQMEKTDTYRLPNEAEWEWACRAKSTGRFSFGDTEAKLKNYAWYASNSDNKTHPVGQLQPNAWGLHDMHGNVWEWCQDWKGPYPDKAVTDPKGPDSGTGRVLRGGSWVSFPWFLRSANRLHHLPDYRFDNAGFRVARTL